MRAELSGMAGYAMARPGEVIFWSLVFRTIYAALIGGLVLSFE